MIREFSEDNRAKFSDIIRRYRESEMTPVTEFVKDASSGLPFAISSYLNDKNSTIDTYQPILTEKIDLAESKISAIYGAVESVDVTYETSVKQFILSVQSQIGFVNKMAETIDPSSGDFTAEGVKANLAPFSEALKIATINDEVAKMRMDDDGEYNYEYIRELMEKNPDEVSIEEYSALTLVFQEMNDEERAKFIESSYFVYDSSVDPDYPKHLEVNYTRYNISDVYKHMAASYDQAIQYLGIDYKNVLYNPDDPQFEQAMEFIRTRSLLQLFATSHSSIFIDSCVVVYEDQCNDLNIDISSITEDTSDDYERFDYHIDMNGKNYWKENPLAEYDDLVTSADVFVFRTNMDTTLDEGVLRTAELFRINVSSGTDIRESAGEYLADTAASIAESLILNSAELLEGIAVGAGLGVITTVADTVDEHAQEVAEAKVASDKINLINEVVMEGNALYALCCGGTVFMDSNGEYVIVNPTVSRDALELYLSAYEFKTQIDLRGVLTAEAIELAVYSGDLSTLPAGSADFVDWFNKYGKDAVVDYVNEKNNVNS